MIDIRMRVKGKEMVDGDGGGGGGGDRRSC